MMAYKSNKLQASYITCPPRYRSNAHQASEAVFLPAHQTKYYHQHTRGGTYSTRHWHIHTNTKKTHPCLLQDTDLCHTGPVDAVQYIYTLSTSTALITVILPHIEIQAMPHPCMAVLYLIVYVFNNCNTHRG